MTVAGCGGGDDETRATVTEALEGIFAAAGVDADQVYLDAYARHSADNVCADLPDDDRWYAVRGADLRGGQVDQDRMLAAAVRHLDEEGYRVERYRPTSGVDRPAIRAVSDDVTLTMFVQEDGRTFAKAFAGPCAERIGRFSARMYDRER